MDKLKGSFHWIAGQLADTHRLVEALDAKTERRFDQIDRRFDKTDRRFDTIEADVRSVKKDVQSLRDDLPVIVGGAVRDALSDR